MPTYTFQSLTLRSEIGANSYALDLDGESIILDAGMHPKEEGPDAIPRYQELAFDSADAILISHSHLDHIGTLPLAQRDHPSAPVYLTPGTAALGDALLHNSVNVMSSQSVELGIKDYPLFHHRELDYLKDRWMTRDYERPFSICPSGDLETEITFHDAGHILGSAGITITHGEKTIFYTGDIHFHDHSLIRGAKFPEDLYEPDLLILETTRGSYPTPEGHSRSREENRFAQALQETLQGGGSALIPVFAIGKTQEILTMLDGFKDKGIIPEKTPIIIGGLSTKMTVLYDQFSKTTRRTRPGFEILQDMDLVTGNRRRRKPIEYKPGAIYCLSSGMMSEKTVSNIFARGFLPTPKNSLLFVGYADPETPAGKIKEASTGDIIRLDGHNKVPLNCRVEEFDFSGHATREEILAFAIKVKPKTLYLVHGDPPATAWFQEQLHSALPDTEICIPEPQKKYTF